MEALDDLLDRDSSDGSGEISLWLTVTLNAFLTLRSTGEHSGHARGWIFDPENEFFQAVAEQLEFAPEVLRQRIKEALKRSRR
jgi:hypothetical protein